MTLNIRHRNCVIVLFVLFQCLLVRSAVCILVCMPPIRACMRERCMNPVSEFVCYEIFIMLGIKFTTKSCCLQGSCSN